MRKQMMGTIDVDGNNLSQEAKTFLTILFNRQEERRLF